MKEREEGGNRREAGQSRSKNNKYNERLMIGRRREEQRTMEYEGENGGG
jgi:hypothetical protein